MKKIITNILYIILLISSPTVYTACTPVNTVSLIRPQAYFPLAVGNHWVYCRILAQEREPLYYYQFIVEEQRNGMSPAGTRLARSGREVSLRSGVEEYKIVRSKSDGFVVSATGSHGLEPYKLMELHELTWTIKNMPDNTIVIWESRRGINLGNLIRVNQMVGLLTTDISLAAINEGREITSINYREPILVPAGEFTETIKNTIKFKGGIGDEDLTIERFFAAGVGLVKEIQHDAQGNQVYSLELLEYYVK